ETAILLQAETTAALQQLDRYAEIDGVDGIFFGPADIATDMGHLADPMHDDVWEAILPAAKRLIAKGMPVGTLVMDIDFAKRLLDEGFTFVGCGTDAILLRMGCDDVVAKLTR
ncbi:MAG: aldolase/citrate lyase family protein, partial [Pseudomonadota bacterium]